MKFRSGDTVRIIASETGHDFEIGEVVTVLRSYQDINGEVANFAKGKNGTWTFSDEEAELIHRD